jgi:hypothetical protein
MRPKVMTKKKTKEFNPEKIQHCLAIIVQLKPSRLITLGFANPKASATAKSEPGN